jgi:two-component system chemotaxis response regulator CheB
VPGTIYLAPGGRHMTVARATTSRRFRSMTAAGQLSAARGRSAVRSAAQVWGSAILAVILTGMGSDGHAAPRTSSRPAAA